MVQYIPGPEQLLAPAAAQITEGVLNFLNPHRQFQQAVQASIAQNPEIAQHFANLEASSPGLLRNMGIGVLAGIPATPEREFEIKNREQIIGGKEAQLGAETAKGLYTTDQINNALGYVQANPGVRIDQALQLLTGQTASERAIKSEEAIQAPLKTAALESGLPVQQAEDKFKMESLGAAQELIQAGPEITMQKFLNDEYSNKQLLGIWGSPLGESLKQQLNFYNDQLRIKLMSGRADDAFDRLKYGRAFDLFTKLNDPNLSIDDVMRYLNRQPGEVADSTDPATAAIQQGLGRLNTGAISSTIQSMDKDVTAALINFKNTEGKNSPTKGPAGDDARALIVKQIDDILDQKSKLPGQQRYKASYEVVARSFARDKKELVFRGPDGKIVGPDKALGTAGGSNEANTPPSSSSTVKDELNSQQLNSFKSELAKYPTEGERQAQLARWKATAPPAQWKQLAAFLGVKP
jgi:hypothetical protein